MKTPFNADRTVQPTVSPQNSFSGRVMSCHSCVSLTSWTTGSVSRESYRGVLCAQSCKVGRLSQRFMAYCPTVVKQFRNKNKTCGRVGTAALRVECLTPECCQCTTHFVHLIKVSIYFLISKKKKFVKTQVTAMQSEYVLYFIFKYLNLINHLKECETSHKI